MMKSFAFIGLMAFASAVCAASLDGDWQLERADGHLEEDTGTFLFIVNGEPVFMHGCDWSPLDALHSRDMRHLHKACEMLTDLNCNMVRMWVGVYEPEAFFDFCDANGILVWQDFAMSNVNPPQNDDFAAEIYDELPFDFKHVREWMK